MRLNRWTAITETSSRLSRLVVVAGALVLGTACTEGLDATPSDTGYVPPGEDTGGYPPFERPINVTGPVVTIVSPTDNTSLVQDELVIRGRATDDSGLASIFVKVGHNSPVPARSRDGFRTWELDAIVPVGDTVIEAWGFDSDGLRSDEHARVLVHRPSTVSDVEAPTVEIVAPEDGSTPLHTVIVLQGASLDDRGVVRMELTVNGDVRGERAFETQDHFATWSRSVALLPGIENVIVVRAFDEAGNSGVAQIRVHARPQDDRSAPSISVTSPAANAQLNTDALAVAGTAHDNLAVREVKVRTAPRTGTTCEDVPWSSYVLATTNDGFATWSATVPLPAGELCMEARAIDISGLSSKTVQTFHNAYQSPWSSEDSFIMRLRPNDTKPLVRLELDRAGLGEVLNEGIQRDLVIAELELDSLLTSTLNTIKSSCGTCWTGSGSGCASTSSYDCSKTSLGCSYGSGPTCTGWKNSPEYALVRLLTLTPNNANIKGSSLGRMADVVDALGSLGLSKSFSDLLADSLGIGKNDTIVSTQGAAKALLDNLIGSHPNIVHRDGKPLMPVTMYDALQDLSTLGATFGPHSSGHPGIVDPASPTFGSVFPADTFRMILVAESNLQWQDGVELGQGKNYLSMIVDDVGPTFDDVVEYDFHNPARFSIVGIPAEPSVDLRFSLYETDRNIPVCENCRNHTPSNPSAGYVWALKPWTLEYILAASAYNTYQTPALHRYTEYRFILKLAEIFVGHAGGRKAGTPAGWTVFDVGGLAQVFTGQPPPPQYMWEAIMDIAEVVGHRNVKDNRPTPNCPNLGNNENEYTICEGDLNPSFTMFNIPTGVTATKLVALARDKMAEQRDLLTNRLLGGFEANNGCVDFYYLRRGGHNMLWLTHSSDPLPSGCVAPAGDGFYSDEALTQKVSATAVSGVNDTVHHKWIATTGEHTLYMRDADNQVWRLIVHVPEPAVSTEITVRTARKL